MLHQRVLLSSGSPLDVYVPDASHAEIPCRPGILICPGGGYDHHAAHEAEPVALRFCALGFNAYVVAYRVSPARYPQGVQDVAAALAHIRRHAPAYSQLPDALAVLGFSAGGHVAGSLGVLWPRADLWAPLGLSCAEVRPNALVLCYPVITAGEWAHRGSFVSLTGAEDPSAHQPFSLENLVTPDTPPTFLWHTWEDQAVPVENTLLMAMALRRCRVSAEVHVYPHGAHGGSLCDATLGRPTKVIPEAQGWPEQAARFLRDVMA